MAQGPTNRKKVKQTATDEVAVADGSMPSLPSVSPNPPSEGDSLGNLNRDNKTAIELLWSRDCQRWGM